MVVEIIAERRGNEPRQSKVEVSSTQFEATVITLNYLAQRRPEVRAHLLVRSNKLLPRIPEKLQCMMMTLPKYIIDEHIINALITNELTHLYKDDEV